MKNNNNINKKIKIKLKKNQPILEAPPFLARKAEIPEVLETLWQCNSWNYDRAFEFVLASYSENFLEGNR